MNSFSRWVVKFMIVNSCIWVYLSYFLAYKGRTQIAEDLSKIIVAQIIAVVFVYSVKALFENLSKHNDWPDKGGRGTDSPDGEHPVQ